jgi:hypothetical protein
VVQREAARSEPLPERDGEAQERERGEDEVQKHTRFLARADKTEQSLRQSHPAKHANYREKIELPFSVGRAFKLAQPSPNAFAFSVFGVFRGSALGFGPLDTIMPSPDSRRHTTPNPIHLSYE